MTLFRLSLAAAAIAFATAAYAYSDEAVKDAEALVQIDQGSLRGWRGDRRRCRAGAGFFCSA